MAWVLFLLVVAGVTGILIWDFRRKSAARESASKQRFDEIFKSRAAAVPAPGAPLADNSLPGAPPQTTAPVAVAAPPARDRFLGQRETLLYRLLKAGIPDHEIFANVALPSVVGGRNDQETRRLSQYRLDFVVCDKGLRIVAAVEVELAGASQTPGERRFVADCLKAAGISLVRLNPAALPRRDEIRALVCGQSGPAVS